MVASIRSTVNKVVCKAEATTKASTMYRANAGRFPGIDLPLGKERFQSLEEIGGAFPVDVSTMLDKVFVDTIVVEIYLPGEQKPVKNNKFRWGIHPEYIHIVTGMFPGCHYITLAQNQASIKDGLVLFQLMVHTNHVPLVAMFDKLLLLKSGLAVVSGYKFVLVNVDFTSDIPGYVKATHPDLLSSIKVDGHRLVPSWNYKGVGMQCPSFKDSAEHYYGKFYNKLSGMLITTDQRGTDAGGSQLDNILWSKHPSVSRSFRDKEIQKHGYTRVELRFLGRLLPDTLDRVKEILAEFVTEAAPQVLGSRSLDNQITRYLAPGHHEFLYLEEQLDQSWKVVIIRWMDRNTGNFNSQSTFSANVKGWQTPRTRDEAIHLGYQWTSGQYPVVVAFGKVGEAIGDPVVCPASGLDGDIKWDCRKRATSHKSETFSRQVTFAEVGMPSMWLEHPPKRAVVPQGLAVAWVNGGKSTSLRPVNANASEGKARSWVKRAVKVARIKMDTMLDPARTTKETSRKPKSLSELKVDKLLVVRIERVGQDWAFLTSDGNWYRMPLGMEQKYQYQMETSWTKPLLFIRGRASSTNTKGGHKWYPHASFYFHTRRTFTEVGKDLGLEPLFFNAGDFIKYGEIVI